MQCRQKCKTKIIPGEGDLPTPTSVHPQDTPSHISTFTGYPIGTLTGYPVIAHTLAHVSVFRGQTINQLCGSHVEVILHSLLHVTGKKKNPKTRHILLVCKQTFPRYNYPHSSLWCPQPGYFLSTDPANVCVYPAIARWKVMGQTRSHIPGDSQISRHLSCLRNAAFVTNGCSSPGRHERLSPSHRSCALGACSQPCALFTEPTPRVPPGPTRTMEGPRGDGARHGTLMAFF